MFAPRASNQQCCWCLSIVPVGGSKAPHPQTRLRRAQVARRSLLQMNSRLFSFYGYYSRFYNFVLVCEKIILGNLFPSVISQILLYLYQGHCVSVYLFGLILETTKHNNRPKPKNIEMTHYGSVGHRTITIYYVDKLLIILEPSIMVRSKLRAETKQSI